MSALEKTLRDLEKSDFEPSNEKRKKVGNYVLERTLGEGSFGKVRLATHVLAKEKVAVKVITKKAIMMRNYLRENIRREAMMLQRLCHPNIVHLYEVMETGNAYYMVLELAAGGEFVRYLSDRKRLNEVETRRYMRQLVSAVDHIHQSGIVHRDIKLDNLLLDDKMNIKIIDFGLGNFCGGDQTLTTQCGSPAFTAPEVFTKKNYGPGVDIWSLGVNMYIMLTGRIPFETNPPNNLTRLYAAMLRGCSVPENLSLGCQDLIQRMLDPKHTSRIKVDEVLLNPWLTEGYTEPVLRISADFSNRHRIISADVVEFLLRFVKMPEKELRRVVSSSKPNSFAAMHHLLVERLHRGAGFPSREDPGNGLTAPVPATEGDNGQEGHFDLPVVQDDGREVKLFNNNTIEFETENFSEVRSSTAVGLDFGKGHNNEDTTETRAKENPCNICQECSPALRGIQSYSAKPPKQIVPSEDMIKNNQCAKCGNCIPSVDTAEPVLEQVLQLQKLLPMFQEIQNSLEIDPRRNGKRSSCNDFVCFLNDVDEETFDRALKLLRGYGNITNPPAPPNSALDGDTRDRNKEPGGNTHSEESTRSSKDGLPQKRRSTNSKREKDRGHITRKLGIGATLDVLPPIENSFETVRGKTNGDDNHLQTMPNNRLFQRLRGDIPPQHPGLQREFTITGADILTTPKRLGKPERATNHAGLSTEYDRFARFSGMRVGQVSNPRLRRSFGEDVPNKGGFAFLKNSKADTTDTLNPNK